MSSDELTYRVRPAAADPEGALFLLHGRGADEHDLFPLFDLLDPQQRLVGITPRGPLALPPAGAHWYQVVRVGYPDPVTFHPTYEALQRWFDAVLADLGVGIERVVVGGFSQGCVMSYSLALGKGRPRPAGLLGLSGFIPTLDRFEVDLEGLDAWPVAIGHGIYDPVIGVEWGRDARRRLEEAGAGVTYRESPMDHTIDPAFMAELRGWLTRVVP